MRTNRKFNTTLIVRTPRIWELDFLRGLCVLLMIWDHFMFDIAFLFADAWTGAGGAAVGLVNFASEYWNGTLRDIFHPVVFIMFFVICGISCSFSKNNLLRGIEALFLAFTISIVTSIINTPITFGVLHMLGFSILTWWAINTLCLKHKYATSIVCLIVGIIVVTLGNLPELWPNVVNEDLFFISETFGGAFNSQDYFPIFPNVGYMLLGAAAAPLLYPKRKSLVPILDKFHWHAPVSFFGKIALWVYVFHQVAAIVILSLISYIFITPGDFVFL